jgi:GDP-4-dehydro-6-deoxy-D-mannose reductase
MGWTDPELVFNVNTQGTLNLLEAFRAEAPEARLLVVSSAEVYGRDKSDRAVREDDELHPDNLYAVSKVAADLATLLYARQYGMHVMTARPQNHIGPGQNHSFVVSSFAEQLARMARKEVPAILRVGNLDSKRDFTDVRDVVRAYRLIVERGQPGMAYNIASGQNVPIMDLLQALCAIAGVEPSVEIDPERYRPTDDPPLLDISRICEHTGWRPEIHIRDSLKDIYDDIAGRMEHT